MRSDPFDFSFQFVYHLFLAVFHVQSKRKKGGTHLLVCLPAFVSWIFLHLFSINCRIPFRFLYNLCRAALEEVKAAKVGDMNYANRRVYG